MLGLRKPNFKTKIIHFEKSHNAENCKGGPLRFFNIHSVANFENRMGTLKARSTLFLNGKVQRYSRGSRLFLRKWEENVHPGIRNNTPLLYSHALIHYAKWSGCLCLAYLQE